MKIAKFFARTVLCLTAAALFLSALSCTPSGKEKEQSASTANGQPDPSDDPEAKSFTLMGCELSEYVIVYAESPYERIYSRRFSTEYDFFKLTAKDIQEKIEERTGVKLPVKSQSAEPVGHEIVVGPAKRDGCPDYSKLDIYESLCAAVGGRLFIGGGYDGREYSGGLKNTYCFASTYHAFDLIEEYLDGKDAVSDIEEGLELKKKNSFVTVACVGDSITEGVGSSDWEKSCHFSYPANLQRLLWKDHIIINYGSGGKTMRSDLTPYTATAQYSAARKYASKFDYILLMLGTNDYLQDAVWTESDNGSFSRSAKVIASGLCKKKNALTVIMNCPAYYGTVSGSPHVRSLQNGLPEYLNGQGINTSFFDMDGFSSKEIGRANYPDLLHPNDNGYYIMAGRLASLLDSLEKGEYTYVLPDYGDEESGKAPDVPLAAGAISLLGEDLSKKHKIENGGYGSWNMEGAPYTLIDGSLFSGCREIGRAHV